MFIHHIDILLKEVPTEISLAFYVCGCPNKCPGCHSPELHFKTNGQYYNLTRFYDTIDKYNHVSCVLFFGGEWEPLKLYYVLQYIKKKQIKTCLYTGKNEIDIPNYIIKNLDYLKTGRYIEKLGGLDSPGTNQKFIKLSTGECLNHYFQKGENL